MIYAPTVSAHTVSRRIKHALVQPTQYVILVLVRLPGLIFHRNGLEVYANIERTLGDSYTAATTRDYGSASAPSSSDTMNHGSAQREGAEAIYWCPTPRLPSINGSHCYATEETCSPPQCWSEARPPPHTRSMYWTIPLPDEDEPLHEDLFEIQSEAGASTDKLDPSAASTLRRCLTPNLSQRPAPFLNNTNSAHRSFQEAGSSHHSVPSASRNIISVHPQSSSQEFALHPSRTTLQKHRERQSAVHAANRE
ncbi:hypothetical protein D9615_006862 [Tricholomella constricta]|uniref:Uncharacterized protein n=1 Tax=Tricholomella constricta TaxID=117010 RepID=A0A8H5H8R6_9AGAR|nr:hypothetical protein D9615_006862 [Tricholomella constricta]